MTWTGPIPLRGLPGPPGQRGDDGEDAPWMPGPAGQTGSTGDAGPAGQQGNMGPPGREGEPGEDGPAVPGVPGNQGPQGDQGFMGPPGTQGEDGESYVSMPGPAGNPGATGATGSQGFMGPPGTQGEDGESYVSTPGPQGNPGSTGPQGIQGFMGPPGREGEPGEDAPWPFVLPPILPVTGGGTGTNVLTNHAMLCGAGTSAVVSLPLGTVGQYLTGFTGGSPVWAAFSGDIAVSALGNAQIAAGVIVDADINAAAAIAWSKLSLAGSAFVAAGASHAVGTVPDPGATSHSNFPYGLGDDAAWHKTSGDFVAAPSTVATQESTTSNTPVELTTTQRLTFTLDETRTIHITGKCDTNSTSSSFSPTLSVDVDGTVTTLGTVTIATGSFGYQIIGFFSTSLGSGAHTLKLMFNTQSAISVNFKNRAFFAELV